MTDAGQRAVRVGRVDLVVDRAGAGPELVWGHGLTSSMAAEDELRLIDWHRVRHSATVTRYDARGHGLSGGSEDPHDLSWRSLADDQLALADALGIGRYVAGGASMGCATALHAAVLEPERIAGLLLVIPPTAWGTRAAQVDRYLTMADLVEAGDHDTLLAGAAEVPPPDPFADVPTWRDRFADTLERTPADRLAAVFRGAATADLPPPERLSELDVPTMILAWTGDPGHPVQTAARLQELLPHADLVLATTPDGVAAWTGRVEAFLRRC